MVLTLKVPAACVKSQKGHHVVYTGEWGVGLLGDPAELPEPQALPSQPAGPQAGPQQSSAPPDPRCHSPQPLPAQ